MNGQPYNNITSIEDHRNSIGLHTKNKKSYNGNGGGGDDMEKRLSNLEAGIGDIKEKLISHDNEFKKIDDKFDKFPTKDFMKISISDAVKSIKLWMFSIILFSLPAFIISIIKLINLHH